MNVDWGLAGAVILSGMVIVFIILIILIWAVMLVSKAVNAASKKPAASVAPIPAPVAAAAPAPKGPAAPAVQAGIGEETVAAISAAIYTCMDEAEPGVSYAVTSIRRADGARPVWGFAGMRQNTRPF